MGGVVDNIKSLFFPFFPSQRVVFVRSGDAVVGKLPVSYCSHSMIQSWHLILRARQIYTAHRKFSNKLTCHHNRSLEPERHTHYIA